MKAEVLIKEVKKKKEEDFLENLLGIKAQRSDLPN